MTKTVQTTASAKPAQTAATSTKDSGKVHIGGGCMRFNSVADAGKVHIGGGCMRF